MHTITVADYIVQRLADIGITACFGVPGDYAFPLNDAIDKNSKVQWIGCANELNAAYAADGYARIKGAAMLSTTYAVGELSALNGVMGAKAEHVTVFHLVGMPSMHQQRRHKILHHSLGDGVFQNFSNISAQACCVQATITPDNCAQEMERVIATALANRQPAYILVAEDMAILPINGNASAWPQPASNADELAQALKDIQDTLNRAQSAVVLPGYTISRFGLRRELQTFLEKNELPFATMVMDKGLLSETHPQFIGMYAGALSDPAVQKTVEGADVVINAGGALFNDANTVAFDFNLDLHKVITIGIDYVRINGRIYNPVLMKDVLVALSQLPVRRRAAVKPHTRRNQPPALRTAPTERITASSLYPSLQNFFKPYDIVMVETGSVAFGLADVALPEGAKFHYQAQWGAIGWATAAAFGTAIADRERRTVLITGEGSHQLTANELGNFARYNVKPVIFVLNNSGYMIERALETFPNWSYNDLAPWRYQALPAALGCQDWFTATVTTNAELEAALAQANNTTVACYIEIIGDRNDYPPRLAHMHARLKQLYG